MKTDGKIGIGTTSPAANLHIKDGSGNTEIKIQGGASTANDIIAFLNSAGSTRGNITYDTDHDFLLFNVNTSERARIDSSGKVGIGTTSPLGTLHVNSGTDNTTFYLQSTDGDVNFGMTDNAGSARILQAGGVFRFRVGGNANAFGTGDNEKMCILADGTIGVGIATPVLKMHLHEASSDNNYLKFTNTTTGSAETDGTHIGLGSDEAFNINQREANDIRLFTSATERLRISSTGNVGIGTSSPARILDVIAASGITQAYIEKNSGSTNNTYQAALTLSAETSGSASSNYGPGIAFQHCFGASNYAGCLISSQCDSDVNAAHLSFYPRNYGYTEALRITAGGKVNIGGQLSQAAHSLSVNKSDGNCIVIGNTSGSSNGSHNAQIVASDGTYFNNLKLTGQEVKIFANVSGGTGITETWKFDTDGNLRCSNAGKGISFINAADVASNESTSSSVLDDYEEGTWTPTDSSGGSLSLTTSLCHYTKVGRLVTITARIQWPTTSDSNYAVIGVPYTASFTPSSSIGSMVAEQNVENEAISVCMNDATSCRFIENGYGDRYTNSTFSGKTLRFTFSYHTT